MLCRMPAYSLEGLSGILGFESNTVSHKHKLLVASFVHTGWLITLDESENHLIKLQGWNRPYDFTKNDDEIGDISDDYECSSTEEDSD